MSKASQIIVLCEDKAHEVFVKRFLKRWGVKPRAIRVPPYPNGTGSGKKYVEDQISLEAEALRRRHASTILLVIEDADDSSVDAVKRCLDEKLGAPRGETEQMAYVIPKWHIQTWLAYMDGKTVEESDKKTYKEEYGKTSESKEAHAMIDRLADHCMENRELQSPPDSLVAACEEFDRIRAAL